MRRMAVVFLLAAASCSPTTDPERHAHRVTSPEGAVKTLPATGDDFDGLRQFADCDALTTYSHAMLEKANESRSSALRDGGERMVGAPPSSAQSVQDSSAEQGPSTAGGLSESSGQTSKTNIQEQGVDESDTTKTDGKTIYVQRYGSIEAVNISTRERAGRLEVDGDPLGMLLVDNTLVAFSAVQPMPVDIAPRPQSGSAREMMSPIINLPGQVQVTTVDISEPSSMKAKSTLKIDGHLTASRMVSGIVRLVVSNDIGARVNQPSVDDLSLEQIVPLYEISQKGGTVSSEPLTDCTNVFRTADPVGASMTTVVTLDPKDPKPQNSIAVLGGSETVYASTKSVYVATTVWNAMPMPGPLMDRPISSNSSSESQLHKFDISDPTLAAYRGSGKLQGRILNQFSMSEQGDILRVAITGASESSVVTMREADGALVKVGEVSGLGVNEQIYSVRFVGNTGYVVTFRQTDPLYVIDLTDPAAPRRVGELKIPGFSNYMHPISEDLVIGVGQDADETGRTQGAQLSVFDVSDPTKPQQVSKLVVGGSSLAQHDHHAFTWWSPTKQIFLPYENYSPDTNVQTSGMLVVTLTGTSLERRTLIVHPKSSQGNKSGYAEDMMYAPAPSRSVVADGKVFTVSETGVMVSSLGTFADVDWIQFPKIDYAMGEYRGR